MRIVIDEPEPQVVLRLRDAGVNGVVLVARVAGSDDEQDILAFTTEGAPTQGDPLGQRNERLVVKTLRVRKDFPAKLDAHGHIEIGMRA